MTDILSNIDLIELLRKNDLENFKLKLENLPYDIFDFTDLLNDEEKKMAIDICRECDIYLLHKMFAKVTKVESLEFILKNLEYYKVHHLRDDEEKTWLHTAVQNNRNIEILRFLVKDIEINVEKTDVNKFTALHFACQKSEYIEGELTILIKQSDQLIAKSFDDITPLELICNDKRKLKEIKRNKLINLNQLLTEIDKISNGLLVTEDYEFNDKLTVEKIYLSLLQKDNKYRLINFIKKDEKFVDKYYLNFDQFMYVLNNCHENGQGILTYIKNRFIKGHQNCCLEKIFTELTDLKTKESLTTDIEDCKNKTEIPHEFFSSIVFLALITGRFELVPTLLTCCQFDTISYGLLICLICKNLLLVTEFPDQVLESIRKLKEFCENYSIAVMNRAVIRDFTPDKRIISGFLNKPSILAGQRILDIAFLSKSTKFLSLPSCQKALSRLWLKGSKKCPALKFYLHSLIHLIFLGLFSYFLVIKFYSNMSVIEIICYLYGIGYFLEETRQIYIYRKKDFLKSYFRDPTNYIDISSLGFMALGFILRLSLRNQNYSDQTDAGLFIESKNVFLFVSRLILCLSMIFFFMRIIYFGSIFEQVGPKLKMISIMIVRDLMPLIFIFIVFIISFGITFQALLYPNSFYGLNYSESFEKKSIPFIIADIFKRSTYTIFHTHYALEEMEHREFPYFVNNEGNIAVFFLLVIFMIVVNIMLINLLIALFSNTVTTIIQKSSESWKANRYKDIKEYYDKSILPPPLNIFEIIVEIIRVQCRKSKVLVVNEEDGMNLINDEENEKRDCVSMSFKILQAFAIRGRRHKLIMTQEDKEYERKTEIRNMKKAIEKIKKTMIEQNSVLL